MKIIVLEGDSLGQDLDWSILSEFGSIEVYGQIEPENVADIIKTADIIIPNKTIVDAKILDGSQVKMVCEAATGYNNIDLNYCKEHGIRVTNVAGYSTDSVAQHTFGLLLSLYEKLYFYNDYAKNGAYEKSKVFGYVDEYFHELSGKIYGIVGLGAIGRKVAEIATAFGCKVIYYSASGNTYDCPYEAVSFEDLLAKSDIISLHCPLNDKTKYLFDEEAFAKMKRTAVLINVARGPVVKDEALYKALDKEEIMAAGLDVFGVEPIETTNPLLKIKDSDRLLMTPHMAWGTVEARNRLLLELKENIKAFINGEERGIVEGAK